jgi:ribonucleoside-triphosphate reductase
MFEKIRKRDGKNVEFDPFKITAAIVKAGKATGEFGEVKAEKLTLRVMNIARDLGHGLLPDVEGMQDIVERVLFDTAYFNTGKAHILFFQLYQFRSLIGRRSIHVLPTAS